MQLSRRLFCLRFQRLFLASAVILGAFGASCASGDFDPNASNEADASVSLDAEDATGASDARIRDTSTSDTRTEDISTADAPQTGDTQVPPDTGDADATVGPPDGSAQEDTAQPGACERANCAPEMTCDPATGACVECLTNAHCANGGVCDPASSTCVECLSDSDCPGETHCHDRAPVCVPACCNTTPSEASLALPDNPYRGFDLALDSAGTPQVAFYNKSAKKLLFTTLLSGNWLRSEQVADIDSTSSLPMRMAVGPNDEPHILVSLPNKVTHFWRTGQNPSVWQSEEVATTNTSYSRVAIAFDSTGGLHMATTQFKAPIIYIYKSASGQLSAPDVQDFPQVYDENTESLQLAVTRDGRPVIATKYRKNIGQPNEEHRFRVYEKLPNATWTRELVGEDIADDFGLGVSADDEPVLAYAHQARDGVHLLKRAAGTWTTQHIITDPNQGFSLAMATDSLGDPHIVYRGIGVGRFWLFYTRWNGVGFEENQIDNLTPEAIEYSNDPRVAVDAARGTHVLTYNSRNHVITYRHLD